MVNALRASEDLPPLSLPAMLDQGLLEYSEFPDTLRGKYQCFTQADISRLRQAGYRRPMLDVEQGVTRYCRWLLEQEAGGWLPEVGQAA